MNHPNPKFHRNQLVRLNNGEQGLKTGSVARVYSTHHLPHGTYVRIFSSQFRVSVPETSLEAIT